LDNGGNNDIIDVPRGTMKKRLGEDLEVYFVEALLEYLRHDQR
jgi:hypothetical protein